MPVANGPTLSQQETVLDTLFEIFRIETPEWLSPFVSGKRLTCAWVSNGSRSFLEAESDFSF